MTHLIYRIFDTNKQIQTLQTDKLTPKILQTWKINTLKNKNTENYPNTQKQTNRNTAQLNIQQANI